MPRIHSPSLPAQTALLKTLALLLVLTAHLQAAEFHVATNGTDLHDGSADRPFATLARVQQAVRAALPQASADITVFIRAGVYRLAQPLLLTEEDSGRDGVRVIWKSADGDGQARLLGSQPLTGWQPHDGRLWKVRVPAGMTFDTLYEAGVRLRKARFPNYRHNPAYPAALEGYFASVAGSPKHASPNRSSWIDYAASDVPPANLCTNRLSIQIFPWGPCDWHRWNCRVTHIDRDARRITFDNLGDRTEVLGGARYFLEDDLALLDVAGEFFLDRASGLLYCIPLGTGHPDTLGIAAPRLRTLVELRGADNSRCIRNVRFEGLSFEETDALSPSLFWWAHAWGRQDHALLRLSNAESISTINCRFRNAGRHGVLLVGHNVGNTVAGCLIEQIGISGITLSNRFAPVPGTAATDRLEQNRLTNNRIRFVGQLGLYASCIELMNVSSNEVSYSDLLHSPRYAVTLRGNTGAQYGPPTLTAHPPARHNRLHHLRVRHCGQDSGDMGALHAACINNPGGDSVNTFEQITVADTGAVNSMADAPPDGIFLDWPCMSMSQVFRDLHVVRSQGKPLRSNGPDNELSAVTANVSWQPGFDASRMAYASIGVRPDFPAAFGGPLAPPVQPALPRRLRIAECRPDRVTLRWAPPAGRWSDTPVYEIFRDGLELARTREPFYVDTTVNAAALHSYAVAARDGDFGPPGPKSAPCEVRVPEDTEPPRLLAARPAQDLRQVIAFFSKPVEVTTATNASLFRLSPGVNVTAARAGASPRTVLLNTSPLSPEKPYTLSVVAQNRRAAGGEAVFLTDAILYRFPSPTVRPTRSLGERLRDVILFSPTPSASSLARFVELFHGGAQLAPVPDWTEQALLLDGHGAWVEAPAELNLGAEDFTLEAWLWKARAGNTVVLSKGNGFGSPHEWTWGWEHPEKAGNIAFRCDNRYIATAPGSLPLRRWTHVVLVRRGNTGLCYVNGTPSGDPQDMSGFRPLVNTHPLLIGRRPYDASPAWFGGMIGEIRILTRALSDAEIRDRALNPRSAGSTE